MTPRSNGHNRAGAGRTAGLELAQLAGGISEAFRRQDRHRRSRSHGQIGRRLDPGKVGGVGLAAGVAALALGGIAAGFQLERQLIGRRLRPLTDADEFFELRADGPEVETLDGVRLHVEVDEIDPDADDASDVTLVFIHGYALNLDCWHFQRKYFRGRHRMVFYDQRSHARSGKSSAKLSRIPQLATDLEQILHEVVGPGPVILIGHSMGGMTITELARRHPEWVGTGQSTDGAESTDEVGPIIGAGLVCTSSDNLLDDHPVRGIPGRVASRLAEPTMAALNRIPSVVEQTRKAGSDLAYLVTRQMTFPTPVPASYVNFVGEMLSLTPLEVIADFYPAFADLDQSEGLGVLNAIPTTVIGGRRDLVTPFRHTEVLVEALPDADTLLIDQCGHLAMIEHHDRVNASLQALIDRSARAGRDPRLGNRAP